jgi:hypothetical protein
VYRIGRLGSLMKHPPHRPVSVIQRCASAFWAASFLLFLVYSAPHRVHHFFEQIQPSAHEDGHNHSDSNRPKTPLNEPTCVFQASVNRCAIGPTAQIELLALTHVIENISVSQENTDQHEFLTAAFQIRAPPIV